MDYRKANKEEKIDQSLLPAEKKTYYIYEDINAVSKKIHFHHCTGLVQLYAICLYVRILTGNYMYCLDGPLVCQLSIGQNQNRK